MKRKRRKGLITTIRKNWQLWLLLMPATIYIIIFCYQPMYGALIAFKDFNPRLGILGSPWAGFKYFEQFFSTSIFSKTLRNTILLSLYNLLWSFPIPIIFALLLNQVQNKKFKTFIQTFLAALTGVNPELHESAMIDGAGIVKRIWHIDIPAILPTIVIMLIMAIGNILSIGYEKVYLLQNGMNLEVSEIISTYVFKTGIRSAQYSFATAVGLFNSVINLILLVAANFIAKKTTEISLF